MLTLSLTGIVILSEILVLCPYCLSPIPTVLELPSVCLAGPIVTRMSGGRVTLSTSVLGPPRSLSIISQERMALLPEMFFGVPQSCSSRLCPSPHRNPIAWCSPQPLGCPRAGRGGTDASLSTTRNLLFQSHLEDLELLKKMKRCRRRRQDFCSLKGKVTKAVKLGSVAQTRSSSAASTPLCRW